MILWMEDKNSSHIAFGGSNLKDFVANYRYIYRLDTMSYRYIPHSLPLSHSKILSLQKQNNRRNVIYFPNIRDFRLPETHSNRHRFMFPLLRYFYILLRDFA